MPILNQIDTETSGAAELHVETPKRTLRVYMMEMWSFIPYYIGRLCAALPAEDVEITPGSVRYHLDRNYFVKIGLVPDRSLLDRGGRFRLGLLRRCIKSAEYLINLFLLARRLSRSRPDILHVQFLPFLERRLPFELWFLKWVRRRGSRIVYTVHNVTRQDSPDRGIALFRRVYSLADALICHGEKARAELIRDFGVPAEKLWVIPHGPLFEGRPELTAQEARSVLGIRGEGPLVLCFGVVSPYKGLPFLLDAWKKVRETCGQGRLLIAGTGDAGVMAEVREKVATLGVEDSVDLWLRFIEVEQLPLLYQAADILVYPYKTGTTSGALLTGLNYGKAIVATRLPFFEEHLKDGQTALLIDYGDTQSMARSLQRLIENREERIRIADALERQVTGRAGWRQIAHQTRGCYDAVVGSATR